MWPCAEQALKAGCASGPQRRGLHFLRDWGSGHRDGDQDSCLNPTITTSQAGSHQDAAPTSCQSLQQPLRVCVCVCVCVRAHVHLRVCGGRDGGLIHPEPSLFFKF